MKSASTKPEDPKPWGLLAALSLVTVVVPLAAGLGLWVKAQQAHRPLQHCAKQQWAWGKAVTHLFHQLRRWEHVAPQCLLAGFHPLSYDREAQQATLWTLEGITQVSQTRANMVHVHPPSPFTSFPDTWLCTKQGVYPLRVKQSLSATVLVFDPLVSPGQSVTQGEWLIPSRQVVYEMRPRLTEPGLYSLMERRGQAQLRPVANGLEQFQVEMTQASPEELSVTVALREGTCQIEETLTLRPRLPSRPGYWTLSNLKPAFVSLAAAPQPEGLP